MSNIHLPIAELKPVLTGLGKVISRASTLPILKMVQIERTRDGWITLTATDLDTHVTARLEEPAQGDPCSILVGCEDLNRITKRCQKNETLIIAKAAGDKALVQFPIGNQTGEEHLESLPPGDFPEVPKIKGEPVSLPNEVRLAIQEAFECASTDETRRILNGAYIDVSDPKCHQIISTDGRHLYGSNSFTLPLGNSILIPDHKFLAWKEFNNDGEWQLRVNDDPAVLQISSRRFRFITRQIDGNYPNWRQVVPAKGGFNTSVELTPPVVESILALVPRIPCHDPINNTLGLITNHRKLILRGRGVNDSRWTDLEVEGVRVTGKPVTIYMNRHFLTKALRFGMTEIEIIDPLSPLRLNGCGKQMIVMPVRSQDQAPPRAVEPATSNAEEQNGSSKAALSDSEADQPAPNGGNERSITMPRNTNNGTVATTNGNGDHQTSGAKSPLESAFEQIEAVKESYRDAIRGLNKLSDTLRQVQRDQKSSEKDVQNVRLTLEKLQSVRL